MLCYFQQIDQAFFVGIDYRNKKMFKKMKIGRF